MSLLGFQQALSELVMSPDFCSAVRTDASRALTVFDLSPLEQQRLVALANQPGLRAGTMIHRSFRLSMLARILPKTCTVLGSQGLKEVVHAYWRTQPPRNLYYEQETARFGEFVLAQLKQGKIQNPFLGEVLRLELAVLSFTRGPRRGESLNGKWELNDPKTCFPYLNPQYRIVFFCHDPEILLVTLGTGQIPQHVLQGDYYVLLIRSPSGQLQIKQVDLRLGELLSACDGQRSVALLCTQLCLAVQDFEMLAESGYIFSL